MMRVNVCSILCPQLNASSGKRGGGDSHHQDLGPENIGLNKDLRLSGFWTLIMGPQPHLPLMPRIMDRLTEHLF